MERASYNPLDVQMEAKFEARLDRRRLQRDERDILKEHNPGYNR